MASLVIDLQDGFSNDAVVITVNGQEVFNKKGVNTDYSIGLAASIETQAPKGSVNIEVSIPSKRISETITVELSETTYLGISILENRIDYLTSDEMFTYF